MKPLYNNEKMRRIEEWAIDEMGVPSILLMEHTGIEVVRIIEESFQGKAIAVFCGPGNNGGDGFAIARLLALKGIDVMVLILAEEGAMKREAAVNYSIIRKLNVPCMHVGPAEPMDMDWLKDRVLVDCIFGTGLSRPVEGVYRTIIECINTSGRPVVSVDVPSGINGDTGETMGVSVVANTTVALGTFKIGHFQGDGYEKRGEIILADIGIPPQAEEGLEANAWLYEEKDIELIGRVKNRGVHKYDSGKVLFFSGSKNMPGAAVFNAMGCIKSGAGLVRLMTEDRVWLSIAGKIPEAVAFTYPSELLEGKDLTSGMVDCMIKSDILVAGSGSGKTPLLRKFIEEALGMENKIVILDADALNLVSEEIGLLDKRGSGTIVILTPHIGEFKRLIGSSIEINSLALASKEFSIEHNVFTVLKGPVTIVAEPGGEVFISAHGHPAMATAGSGDVLTGVIAGVLAQIPRTMAGLLEAVGIHQKAGRIAAGEMHERSVSATDIGESLPAALNDITK